MYSIELYHGNYNRVKRVSEVKYIVVHYTGSGTSKAGSAKANCIFFSRGNRNASAHYFIDDSHIFEYADPKIYACWHVGDGHGKYGITNQNSIGIEVCSGGANFTEAEINRLAWLVQTLMKRFGIDAKHVVRHYDASHKCCPAPYAPNGKDPSGSKWRALHARITGGKVTGSTPSTPSKPSSVSKPTKSTSNKEAWYCGPNVTLLWQKACGTKADGVISGQSHSDDKYRSNVTSCEYGDEGSNLIRYVQRKVGTDVDGFWGRETSGKIQEFLIRNGFSCGSSGADHYFGSDSVKALYMSLVKKPGIWK